MQGRQQHFGIRARRKLLALGGKLVTQLEVVVELSVVRETALVATFHGLQARIAQIDDGQALVREHHRIARDRVGLPPAAIRPAMSPALPPRHRASPLRSAGCR